MKLFTYSFLSLLYRELPVPLLTREYLPAFSSIADISDLKEQVRTLNLLILLLPDLNQKVLKVLEGVCSGSKVNAQLSHNVHGQQ